MKKNFSSTLLLFAVMLIGLNACTKKDINSNENARTEIAPPASSQSNFSGTSSVFPLSNYDGAGIMHNEGLNYTLTTPGYSSMQASEQVATVTKYFVENQIEADLSISADEIESELGEVVPMSPSGFSSHIVNSLNGNPVWQQHIARINRLVINAGDDAPADVLSAQLRTYEASVMNNAAISYYDKNAILQYSAIVRNSQEYWKGFTDNQQVLGRFNASACWECIKRNWRKLALSDGWGFITGLLKGGPKTGVVKAIAKSAVSLFKHCRSECFW